MTSNTALPTNASLNALIDIKNIRKKTLKFSIVCFIVLALLLRGFSPLLSSFFDNGLGCIAVAAFASIFISFFMMAWYARQAVRQLDPAIQQLFKERARQTGSQSATPQKSPDFFMDNLYPYGPDTPVYGELLKPPAHQPFVTEQLNQIYKPPHSS